MTEKISGTIFIGKHGEKYTTTGCGMGTLNEQEAFKERMVKLGKMTEDGYWIYGDKK